MSKMKYTKKDLKSAYIHGTWNAMDTEAGLAGTVSFKDWFRWFKINNKK